MLFSSTVFLFVFLPGVLFCYYALFRKSRSLQNILLLFASLFFYAWGEPKFVIVMVLSIAANWLFGLMVNRHKEKKVIARIITVIAAGFNLGILFVFKYMMFTLDGINSLFGLNITPPGIALPIGISFFTFQALSYVADVKRGKGEAQKNPLNVGLYISFFPQLIAGPIVRYETVADAIKNRKETLDDFSSGVIRFMAGFLKKVLIANTMAVVADNAFNSPGTLSAGLAWLGVIAYAFQIYFDFSGYSDMAIGLGRMFGFHFHENFNYPYVSTSISDFWRRWHISLGSWFKDYVYFPLGGSRVQSKVHLVRNLFVVWLLTGIWHGANWTFILWGLMFFVLICFEKLTGFEEKLKNHAWLKHSYTMLFVLFGWVLFRAENLSAAGTYFLSMFGLAGNPLSDSVFVFNLTQNPVIFISALIFSLPVAKLFREKVADRFVATQAIYAACVSVLFVTAVSFVIKGSYNPFIYFNF